MQPLTLQDKVLYTDCLMLQQLYLQSGYPNRRRTTCACCHLTRFYDLEIRNVEMPTIIQEVYITRSDIKVELMNKPFVDIEKAAVLIYNTNREFMK